MKPFIILINPLSSFSYYYERLSGDFRILVVFSDNLVPSDDIIERYSDKFLLLTGIFHKDVHALTSIVDDVGLVFALNCNESQLIYSERIINSLQPKYFQQNSEAAVKLRENKYSMQSALKDYGINNIRQRVISHEQRGASFSFDSLPLVVKPMNDSYCSSGVFICNSIDDIRKAINYNFSATTILNKRCENVILEDFISGDEYIVDGFVTNGELLTSGVFLYKKNIIDKHPVYNHISTIEYEGCEWTRLVDYAKDAVKALRITTGLVHFELMMNNDGVWMIELNSRLSGCSGAINQLSQYVYGIDQISLIKKSVGLVVCHEKPFRYGRVYCLQGNSEAMPDLLQIKETCSVVDFIINKPTSFTGEKDNSSQSLLDTLAYIILSDDSIDNINKASDKLDRLSVSEPSSF